MTELEAQENKVQRQYKNAGLDFCPFCGETYKLDLRRSMFGSSYVVCCRCLAQTRFFDTTPGGKSGDQKARDAWNMRRKPQKVIRDPADRKL